MMKPNKPDQARQESSRTVQKRKNEKKTMTTATIHVCVSVLQAQLGSFWCLVSCDLLISISPTGSGGAIHIHYRFALWRSLHFTLPGEMCHSA
jgi:hypothetical protein